MVEKHILWENNMKNDSFLIRKATRKKQIFNKKDEINGKKMDNNKVTHK